MVSVYGKLANVPIFKKGKTTQVITGLPVSFLEPGKVIEVILGITEKYLKDCAATGHSQQKFTRRKPCLTNLTSFYGKASYHVDQGKPANVIFWDFSEAFSIISHSVTLDKMSSI